MATIEPIKPIPPGKPEKPAGRAAKNNKAVHVRSDLERALIGAIGALVPVLAILYTGGLTRLGPEFYMNAVIAAVVGAVIAWAQPEIRNRFGVVQIGMSVPALLASLVVSSEATRQRNLNEARNQSTTASAPAPAPSSPSGRLERGGGDLFGLVVAAHADEQTPMVKAAPVGVLEYLGLKARRDWFVITALFPVERAAREAAGKISSRTKAEVLGVPTSQGVLYAVVIGQNLTFEEANQLRDASIAKGLPKSTRVWTTDLPPGTVTPVCDTKEVNAMRWRDFSDTFGQPAYAYVGTMDRKAVGFRVRVIFPDKSFSIPPGPSREADVEAQTAQMPGSWLTFSNNAPREPAETVTAGGKRFEVHVPKIDFGSTSEDDLDLRICRVS